MATDFGSRFEGMTTNERLFQAGLLDQWDAAVRGRDRACMLRVLAEVDLTDQAEAIADTVLRDPARYGF